MSETTSSRLLRLLSLMQGRRDWPGDELADRLEVSGRTVRRDVERLRGLGYPIESLTGPAGGYRLRRAPRCRRCCSTTRRRSRSRSACAPPRVVGRRASRRRPCGRSSSSSRSCPSTCGGGCTRSAATATLSAGSGPMVDPQDLTVVASACRDRERLRFGYEARDGATAGGWSSRSRSSTSAAAGTWSPGTAAARTGAPSASTGSPARAAGGRCDARELPAARTPPPTWRQPVRRPAALRRAGHRPVPAGDARAEPPLLGHGRADRRRDLRAAHQRGRPRLAGARIPCWARLRGPRAARADRAPGDAWGSGSAWWVKAARTSTAAG